MDLSKKYYTYKAFNKTCDQAHVRNKYGKETQILWTCYIQKKKASLHAQAPTQPWMKRCNKKVKLQ